MKITQMKEKVDDVHKRLVGNGKPGLIDEWNRLQGSIAVWKFIAGSSLLLSLVKLFIA